MSSKRQSDLDLLRGIACLMVVAFHYLHRGQRGGWVSDAALPLVDQVASFGYLGVHLFFMLSGYVIFMSAEGATLRRFAASRVKRLYPMLWAGVLLTAAVTALWGAPHFSVTGAQVVANLTMVPHWLGIEYVDGAYWSLAVELQFYLLMAALIALGALGRAEWFMAGWLLLGTLNVLRPVYRLEFWLVVQWASLFVAGMLCWRARSSGWNRARIALMLWAWLLTLAYLARTAFLPGRGETGGGSVAGFAVTAALVTLFHLVFIAVAARRLPVPGGGWVTWMGVLTYPVYILHQNIGYIALEAAAWRGVDLHLRVAVVLAGVVALAWAVNRWVERPVAERLGAALMPRH